MTTRSIPAVAAAGETLSSLSGVNYGQTAEWLEAFDQVISIDGTHEASQLLEALLNYAVVPCAATTQLGATPCIAPNRC